MPKEKSCGAVLFRKHEGISQYLVLHYGAGHWDFPKGHQEKGEKDEMTAAREISEETGIVDIELTGGFREAISYFYRKGEDTVFKEVIFFLAEARAGEVTLSGEHIGYAWLSYEHAFKKLTFSNAKEVLRKANQFLYKGKL